MLEREPRLPNYEDLRKLHEEPSPAQPPNHQPNRPDYEELKNPQKAAREPEEAKSRPQPEPTNIVDDVEAKIAAYQKDLDARVEAGRITPKDSTNLMARYQNQLVMTIKSQEAVLGRDVQEPRQETAQQQQAERKEVQEQQQPAKRPDWQLMITDPTYRRQVEKQIADERAAYLHKMQHERDGGSQRTGSGGRER